MKQWIKTTLLAMLVSSPVFAGDQPIRLYNLSGQDEAVIDRSIEYMKSITRFEVVEGTTDVKQQTGNQAQLDALKGKLSDPAFAHIVFFNAGADEKEFATLDEQDHILVINLAGIRTNKMETYARRLDRQIMRNLFFLLGRSTCPNPQCALFDYKNLKVMDNIGRCPCPPCLISGLAQAKAKGVSATKSPMDLLLEKKAKEAGAVDAPKLKGVPPGSKPGVALPKIVPPKVKAQ